MPSLNRFFFLFALVLLLPAYCAAQDSGRGSSTVLRLEPADQPDTSRAIVRVLIRETEQPEPIQGATVLLRREADKMYGRVTQADGQCAFRVGEGTYVIRVQMTGLVSFEQHNFLFEKGKSYTLEIGMAKL
ncbi:MAG TPA: carboxypeptidase-like regulatory domain-containing protein [Saprospiraceae bacterium]|nr:carboxypeptidase-like regulatory domain-containing protein [Saprospiraceae bacterium]HNG89564.1 carboxypeptidase-like regulatory domain-containing protein [Saprospiraceae bacterium]